jgi:hypothetical protein
LRNWKSIGELSALLRVDSDSLLEFVERADLGHLLRNNRIRNNDLSELLSRYKAEFDLNSRTWPIPEWLSSADDLASRTLVEMYREETSYPASLPPSQGKILHDLVVESQPENLVEIGCFIGISSTWIGSALEQLGSGHLFSVDLFA